MKNNSENNPTNDRKNNSRNEANYESKPNTKTPLEANKKYILKSIDGPPQLRERLLDMGFVCDLQIEVLGVLPLGGAILVRFANTMLALRQEEVQCLNCKILA